MYPISIDQKLHGFEIAFPSFRTWYLSHEASMFLFLNSERSYGMMNALKY